ncbi:glucan 1,3-beta-glucosidase [Thozetella sp. PMI_491]|nr:glucan 1,3-beta-glucosidase [Thozetella sp. PMI_491]
MVASSDPLVAEPVVVGGASNPPCTMLRVRGTDIVNEAGEKIVLKGAAIAGFLNMENFITGYSGHEHEHRAALARVLGEKKAKFFFDRLIHHFFSEADAAYYASLGLNCIRIPLNYRHFIDPNNPETIKQEGMDMLDRCVNLCAKYNIYVVLDLHAAPGGQNQDWHSDAGVSRAMFWEFKDFQDRAIQLWEALARRYAGNPVVAGYNPLNEPADPEYIRLTAWYRRAEKAIRAIDPEHILFIDGNTYSMDFSRFTPEDLFPNVVYSCHDYSIFGFPIGEVYEGTDEQKQKNRTNFERKIQFMRKHNVPIWNGEFGPVYADERTEGKEAALAINERRFACLRDQLAMYHEMGGVSWSIWLYKDIGYQGMVYLSPDSAYMRLIQDFVDKKKRLGVDFWGVTNRDAVKNVYEPFVNSLKQMVPEQFWDAKYPKIWTFDRQIERVVRECLLSEYLGYEMAELFRDKTEDELEELAKSFSLENCRIRDGLNQILRDDAKRRI